MDRTKKTTPSYLSGETIQVGDRVMIGDWDGIVEEIVVPGCPVWDEYWMEETGEGVMIVGPAFGRLFTALNDEELVFVARRQA